MTATLLFSLPLPLLAFSSSTYSLLSLSLFFFFVLARRLPQNRPLAFLFSRFCLSSLSSLSLFLALAFSCMSSVAMLGAIGRVVPRFVTRTPSAAVTGRRTASTLVNDALVAPRPPNTSFLTVLGVLIVAPAAIYGGAEAARTLVAYVEDNDIWRPSVRGQPF